MPDQQLHLFEKPRLSIEDRFRRFHRQNPHVMREIHRRAERDRIAGAQWIGVKGIVEEMRKDPDLRTSGEQYKFDNSFTAFYARELLRIAPEFTGIVRTKG